MGERMRRRLLRTAMALGILAASGGAVYLSGRSGSGASEPARKRFSFAPALPAPYPASGEELSFSWGGLGSLLVASGTIDQPKLEAAYAGRGGLGSDMDAMLNGNVAGAITVSQRDSGFLLNLLWALGLANDNPVLTGGPISDPRYGDVGSNASTGGWTLGMEDGMSHFAKHRLISLTPAQQSLVEKVARQVYRPCCDNPAYFPDCNHGMAMLGLLEVAAAQGGGEQELYRSALLANYYWFPQYRTVAGYLADRGDGWESHSPQQLLGREYSSLSGYSALAAKAKDGTSGAGVSCGI